MTCSSCGSENPPGYRFCASCGNPLPRPCPNCGAESLPDARFCGNCGTQLDDSAPAAAAPADDGLERRLVTVLFADIVNFSTLAEAMDPEDLRSIVTTAFGALVAEIESRGGRVEKFIGDAVMAMFGVPLAREDDPVRATAASLAMFEAIERISSTLPTPARLRMGINSGLVVAGSVGDGSQTGVMGDAVNVASRLQQAAEPGQVLVSAAVWRRVRDRYDGEHVGALDVKGRAQPVDAYRIVAARPEQLRRRSPFVGRREERGILDLLWSSALKGNTHVVSIVGEPGVGKSRLLREFAQHEDARDIWIDSGEGVAFGVFMNLIDCLLGRLPKDIDDLRGLVVPVADVDDDVLQQIAALLGLAESENGPAAPTEPNRRQAFAGVWEFIASALRRTPACMVVEDLHWSDESSLALLQYLLERAGGTPLLLALSYRPGFDRVEHWTLRPSHMTVPLELLSGQESVDLARGYLGVATLPRDLERLVATRAEGNPFFIEELLEALLELGSLKVEDGEAKLATLHIEIPDTVEGTILARIDSLPPRLRSILQHAAVLGRTFTTELLRDLSGDDDVTSGLEELARAQLLTTVRAEEWSFRHAIIHEVAYETILLKHRRELHRRAALALAEGGTVDPTLMERLAAHYALAEDRQAARTYAVMAGDMARDRFGFAEARRHYQTALSQWDQDDEHGRLDLLMKLAWASHVAADRTTAMTALIEAEAGFRALGNTKEAASALAIQGRLHFLSGETARAQELLDEAIRLLEPHGSTPEIVQAIVYASALPTTTGDVETGAAQAARGSRIAEELGLDAAQASLLTSRGAMEVLGGDAAGAARIAEAVELAERIGEAETRGRAAINLGIALRELGANREGLEVCRKGRETMRRAGAPGFEGVMVANLACMLVELGQLPEAEEAAHEVLGALRPPTAVPGLAFAANALASSMLRRGALDESRAVLDEFVPMALRAGPLVAGPLLCTESELEEARGNTASARRAAGSAVEVTMATSAVSHWFRPLLRSARLGLGAEIAESLARAATRATFPLLQARLAETHAVLASDTAAFGRVAERYAGLELPFDEMRCRHDAGDVRGAGDIAGRFGFHRPD